ncbi:MAG: DNA ligase D [Usitatibacter sp.]
MAGSLSAYWKKRNFGVTSEPRGEVATRRGKALAFVVQKHAASRLHYDFRLEVEGTMVSWAVPKGPSLDPQVRRMAVHVEDHPISYNSFEGVIPKGQYGAGTVEVWDRGTWAPLEGDPAKAVREGKLKFEMHGEKLRGKWMLVRINNRKDERQEPWLLIKERDAEARPASEYDIVEEMPDSVLSPPGGTPSDAKPRAKAAKKTAAARGKRASAGDPSLPPGAVKAKLPLSLFPQLATLVEEPPKGKGWIYEVKFDGYRVVTRVEGDDVRLFTRNGHDWTARLAALRDQVAAMGLDSAWHDGEIVVLDAKGNPSFQALQGAFDTAKTGDIAYFVFDMPYFGGYDLRRVPLVDRRALLEKVLESVPARRVRFSEHFDADAAQLLASACKRGLEGIIGKRSDSIYISKRSADWIKLKCTRRQEFVVVGYTDPKGSRSGFGSLLLAVHDESGKLRYAGNVGTGFDEGLLRTIRKKLAALDAETSPVDGVPRSVKGHWVKPRLVAEVSFTEWTDDGRIRHPVFHGLRIDKAPESITRESAQHEAPPAARGRKPAADGEGDRVHGLKVSNPDRVIDPASKATKLDLVRYYDRIAGHMLEHLAGRPVALVRAPSGVEGELFFQKHGDTLKIPGIRELDPKLWPGHPAMLEVSSREGLVGAAQMNVIEFHTWNSTTRAIDKPDRMIFDLDPGEGITWAQLLEATALTHKMLDMLGLESFLKTSGGKGLHVVVPLTPRLGYDEVKDFSQAVVVHLARTLPSLFVAKSGARNRVGRIFVDYLRNGRGATTAAAFSARTRPGLGVSVPLAWGELAKLKAANQWNIFSVHERLAKLREDPWKDYAKTKQTIAAAVKRLEG